jgi:nicotinamide phosphoribosyltransferase
LKLEASCGTDGYKVGHGPMYRRGTKRVNSNNTPRTDRIYRQKATSFYDGLLVVAGIQGGVQEIHEVWQDSFFSKPKSEVINFFATLMTGYFGSRPLAVAQLASLHDIGYLPIEIKALAEGSKVPMGTPVFTITNTVDEAFWLVNYLETILSDTTWQPMTNATIAEEYFAIADYFRQLTGGTEFDVKIQMHDFSARGMPGMEAATRANFPHLWRFLGTDTISCLPYAVRYYDTPAGSLIGVSVPATEHAVTSSNILAIEDELRNSVYKFLTEEQKAIFNRMLDAREDPRLIAEVMFVYELITDLVPQGIVSNVSDTYDFWAMMTRGYLYLKDVIMRRQSNGVTPGRLVKRPDSGDPVKVLCGYAPGEYLKRGDKYFEYFVENGIDRIGNEIPEHEIKGAVQLEWENFDGTVNEKGYKVLNEHVGLIYGDSITPARALEILTRLEKKGFASSCVVFGIGSYSYQCNTRDTFGFAVKATSTVVGEKRIAIFKAPKTDSKKNSAKGLLFVGRNSEGYFLLDDVSPEEEASEENMLRPLYKNGIFVRRTTLAEIRDRLERQ